MKKNLVVYYSFEGGTEKIANKIAERVEADLIKLKPLKNITAKKGIGKFFWGGMKVVMKIEPELENFETDIEQYENIFIASPVWAGNAAPPIKTFSSKVKMKNKKLFFLCTYEGGLGKMFDRMRNMFPENNYVAEKAFLINKEGVEKVFEEVDSWLEDITDKLKG